MMLINENQQYFVSRLFFCLFRIVLSFFSTGRWFSLSHFQRSGCHTVLHPDFRLLQWRAFSTESSSVCYGVYRSLLVHTGYRHTPALLSWSTAFSKNASKLGGLHCHHPILLGYFDSIRRNHQKLQNFVRASNVPHFSTVKIFLRYASVYANTSCQFAWTVLLNLHPCSGGGSLWQPCLLLWTEDARN